MHDVGHGTNVARMEASGVEADAGRRWAVLAAGVIALTAACAFQFGMPYLVPRLTADGSSLADASWVVAAPSLGLLLTLVAWGAVADRWGERAVLATGLGLAVPALLVGTALPEGHPLGLAACLVVAGAAGASVHAASGRLILGWFAVHERGLAMGVRQTSQPLGVAVAALSLPTLADHGGIRAALAALAGLALAATVLVVLLVRDPKRAPAAAGDTAGSPYRTGVLWRIHGASALLVIPQFAVAAFGLAFLVDERHWSPAAGGLLLGLAQLGGAGCRLGAGWWSDRVRTRTGPLRQVAVAVAVAVGLLALAALARSPLAAAVLVIAAMVTVSPNGLAFTAVAEYAGPSWAGRALGLQNTVQNLAAALTPPVLARLIGLHGYATAFAAAAAAPVLAAAVVPRLVAGLAATPRIVTGGTADPARPG